MMMTKNQIYGLVCWVLLAVSAFLLLVLHGNRFLIGVICWTGGYLSRKLFEWVWIRYQEAKK